LRYSSSERPGWPPLGNIYRGVLPFLAINFATLMLITYVPAISMLLLGHGR
jgi:C4-dicarboxylate transporter DctM subunit